MSFRQTSYGKITSDWEIKKVSEYLSVLTDYVANGSFASLKNNVQYYSEPNYAILLRLTDYNNSYKGNFVYIDERGYNFLSKTKLYGGEIIISNVGANVGTVFKAPQLNFKMNLGPNAIMLKTQGNDDFYYYWFKSPQGQAQIKAILSGSAQPKFNKTAFKNVELPVPPLKEQKAIANILSSLDDKIELNNQMNETLEEMAQALFKRWFVDFEFLNEEGQPYKSSGGEMVESELGMIPRGWEVTTLESLCSLSTKSVKPFENPEVLYEHFSLPACDDGKLPVIEYGSQINSNKYKIDNNCILISKLNPSTKRIWDPVCKENGICSTEFMVYQPKYNEIKPFCYELINSDRFTEYLLCNVTGSTGSRQRVQPKLTMKYQFVTSSRSLIEQFSELVKPMHDKIKENIEENKILKQTRDSLLPKLLSGEIRVSDLEE